MHYSDDRKYFLKTCSRTKYILHLTVKVFNNALKMLEYMFYLKIILTDRNSSPGHLNEKKLLDCLIFSLDLHSFLCQCISSCQFKKKTTTEQNDIRHMYLFNIIIFNILNSRFQEEVKNVQLLTRRTTIDENQL